MMGRATGFGYRMEKILHQTTRLITLMIQQFITITIRLNWTKKSKPLSPPSLRCLSNLPRLEVRPRLGQQYRLTHLRHRLLRDTKQKGTNRELWWYTYLKAAYPLKSWGCCRRDIH